MKEIEEEAAMLRRLQVEVEKQLNMNSSRPPARIYASLEDKVEADNRSIYIGNVSFDSLISSPRGKALDFELSLMLFFASFCVLIIDTISTTQEKIHQVKGYPQISTCAPVVSRWRPLYPYLCVSVCLSVS